MYHSGFFYAHDRSLSRVHLREPVPYLPGLTFSSKESQMPLLFQNTRRVEQRSHSVSKSNTTLTAIQQFLSAIYKYLLPDIRTAGDFLIAFPPNVIMESIYDNVELRANVLLVTAETSVRVGSKISKSHAIESLEIALTEHVVEPNVVLEVLEPDDRVRHLNNQDLWSFVTEPKFWELEWDAERAQAAKNMIAVMLETAHRLELITSEEIVRSIGFSTFFGKETQKDLVATLEAFANAGPKGFEILLDRYDPKKIVANVSLQVIWEKVVHPLIAVRHGLASKTDQSKPKDSSVANSPVTSASAHRIDEKPIATASSPIASQSSVAPTNTGDTTKKDVHPIPGSIVRPSTLVGPPASSIPAASRMSTVTREGNDPNPKASTASDTDSQDADGEMTVEETEIYEDGSTNLPAVATATDHQIVDSSPEVVVHNSAPEITVSDQLPHDTTAVVEPQKKSEPSSPKPSTEIARPFGSRPSSSTFPAVTHPAPVPPRRRHNTRPHPTGDDDMELEVGSVSPLDTDVRAALQEESASSNAGNVIPSGRTRRNTGTYIPDDEFVRAGGAKASDPLPNSSELSRTPMSSKMAVCGLLRSSDIGLKLLKSDPINSTTFEMITAALEELDSVTYNNARARFREMNQESLGNALCKEVKDRYGQAISDRLRHLLIDIGYASDIGSSPASVARPPPLPQTKSSASNPSASGQHSSRIPTAKG